MAALLVGVARSAGAGASGAGPTPLLPDLELAKPDGMKVKRVFVSGAFHWHLGFISAAENVGDGPLLIRASRPSTDTPTMGADQVIGMSDGTETTVPDVGGVRYLADPTHQHWHLLRFMTYELRSAKGFRLLRPDQKTGFCLGDRYKAPRDSDRPLPRLPAAPPKPVFIGNCAPGDATALSVEEGISVGYGDVYSAQRDGQYVDITGLKSGMYVLVHRVNPDRSLRESNYANNASALVFDLSWPRGYSRAPRIELRGRCADAVRCRPQW